MSFVDDAMKQRVKACSGMPVSTRPAVKSLVMLFMLGMLFLNQCFIYKMFRLNSDRTAAILSIGNCEVDVFILL